MSDSADSLEHGLPLGKFRSVEIEASEALLPARARPAAGRVHFSRSIDADATALCPRILTLAGRAGEPVSRAEADALFDINAVASERRDGGRFDDLLAKPVVHHVMSACGYDVPGRDIALAPRQC
jgi:hypothetical protein